MDMDIVERIEGYTFAPIHPKGISSEYGKFWNKLSYDITLLTISF